MDKARRAVWIALSDLFLDTDVESFHVSTAQVCAASPYSVAELERIFEEEVAPVCQSNLFQVAGEWAGFDNEALVAAIAARPPRRHRFSTAGSSDFRAVASLIERIRAGSSADAE
ncbi:MAG: hypothetical protein FJW38_15110 [Acidobacteria bacterium]|nr:hypothetical protein [Acidobacteriota bacterium]